jgi:uncharacterized paraquat-inducible protein A
MQVLLYAVGGIIIMVSLIAGVASGSFFRFLFTVASGGITAAIFFALAMIMGNQEDIIYRLDRQEERMRRMLTKEKVVCPKCNYEHDSDYSSCPHCGYRES